MANQTSSCQPKNEISNQASTIQAYLDKYESKDSSSKTSGEALQEQDDCNFVNTIQNPVVQSYIEWFLLSILIIFSFYFSIIHKDQDLS